MSRGWLRARAFLDRQYGPVLAALAVLALAGGWLTYGAYAAPGTHTEERTVASWETTGAFEHGATVVEPNPVFDNGSELDNRSTYFRSVAPVLDGTFRAGYAGAERADLSVRANVTLAVRSVGEDGETPTEYWRTTRSLGAADADSVSPGESVAVPFSVDTDAVANRTARIRDRLGTAPGEINVTVRATVQYAGTVDGQRVDRTETYSLPMVVGGSVYRVDDPGTATNTYETTRTETVVERPGLVSGVGGPLVLVGSLVAAVVLAVARRRGVTTLTETEREWLAFREDRRDFAEWIVTMRLPAEIENLPKAEADGLADLVDFAIGTDNAVIEHPDDGTFVVVHDGYRYAYSSPPDPRGEYVDRGQNEGEAEDGSGSLSVDYHFGNLDGGKTVPEEDGSDDELPDSGETTDDADSTDAEEPDDAGEPRATSE